jgi:2-haloacid dehalogenase
MSEPGIPPDRFDGLLLDADNTLLDFDRAERTALLQTFARSLTPQQAAGLVGAFHAINARLWRQFEEGSIDQAHLRVERFRLLARELRLDGDPQLLAARYIENLSSKGYLRPHAMAVLQALHGQVGMALISNGLARVQRARLARARIGRFFDSVLISEEIGVAKPDPQFFDLAVQRLGLTREQVLCVGDSPSSDIRGGHLAGLTTCWYVYPPRPYPPEEPEPDHRIEDLRQLRALVGARS